MNSDLVIFAAIFIIAVAATCGSLGLIGLSRLGTSSVGRPGKFKHSYHRKAHHA